MFKSEKFIEEKVEELKNTIKDRAIVGISGGVDSATAALLVNRAIGKRLTCILVDTGYMRKNEVEENARVLKKLSLNISVVDAKDRFYKKLQKVTEPEKKRKIIGKLFIRIFEEVAKKNKTRYLVQGTIAPDWIESGGGLRDKIKSHQYVGGLPKNIAFKIIEPLRDLYKDEVRLVGQKLGLPEEIYQRQPFPGPGLSIRILGEATPDRAEIIREACAIVEKEIEKAAKKKEIEKPWQYFAVLLPLKAVGVHGDLRAYKNILVVRAVQSLDGMSAAYSKIPHSVLERISVKITNKLKDHVGRVLFDITNKPPGTIEYE